MYNDEYRGPSANRLGVTGAYDWATSTHKASSMAGFTDRVTPPHV
jgi:hypothetical protein